MNIKQLALLAVLAVTSLTTASAQYQTVLITGTTTTTVNVPAGQVCQLLNFTHEFSNAGTAVITQGANTISLTSVNSSANAKDLHITGPATISVTGFAGVRYMLTYKLFENSTVAGPTIPSTAVVIPADAAGPVNIILESSTDLITWTPATPGSYGSSTSKRFFRVRAVNQ